MTWLPPGEYARVLGIAPRTLRDRVSANPGGFKRDERGHYWHGEPPGNPGTFRAQGTPAHDVEKWILIPDVHVPYHDATALRLVLEAAKAIGATRCVQLGDLMDCYSVSRYPKDANRRSSIQWEIEETNKVLDSLDAAFPDGRVITLGNHDVRLEKYVATYAPAIGALYSMPELLRLKERGWQVTPYLQSARIGDLDVTHEMGFAGAHASHRNLSVTSRSTAHGHTHRVSMAAAGDIDGSVRVGMSCGWLGSFDAIDYAHRQRAYRETTHGFGVAYVDKSDGGRTHVVPVVIMGGRCVVEGRLIR